MKKICIMFVHGIGKRDKKVLEEMGRPVLEYLNAPKKFTRVLVVMKINGI